MIALGVVGALVAMFGTVVGWVFVGQLANASDDSLDGHHPDAGCRR